MNRSRPALHKALLAEVPADSRLLLGVSGGVDSMVLLHGVLALRAELRLAVEVAHIDHGLRPESSEDGAFVAAAARLHDLPFHLVRVDPPTGGVNIEAWGRKTRYDFFRTIRAERSLDWSLTAHTADDVSETLLMRLVSNKELRTIHRRDNGAALLRPLLGVTRDEVVRYAREFGVVWREDGTNLDRSFLRNRVRHELLPVLRRFDERIVEILSARAEALATDDSYLEGEALGLLHSITFGWGERRWLQGVRALLESASPPIRWRIGEHIAFSKLGFRIGRFHADRVVEFILGNGGVLELPGKTSFIRRDGGLVVVESGSRHA